MHPIVLVYFDVCVGLFDFRLKVKSILNEQFKICFDHKFAMRVFAILLFKLFAELHAFLHSINFCVRMNNVTVANGGFVFISPSHHQLNRT